MKIALLVPALLLFAACGPYISGAHHEWATTCAAPVPLDYEARSGPDGTVLELGRDDTSDWIDLPFSFPFFDDDVDRFYVSSNGFVGFDDREKHGCCIGQLMPDDDGRNGIVAAGWTDLNLDQGGSVAWGATDERVWVEWSEVPVNEGAEGEMLDAYVVLLPSGIADVQITHFESAIEATIGAEDIAGDRGVCAADRLMTSMTVSEEGWRFNTQNQP